MCKIKWKGRRKIKWHNADLVIFTPPPPKKKESFFWHFLEHIVFAFSLLTRSRTQRAHAVQELRDRDEVEKELSVVKAWIQETRELLLNPTQDIDFLLQELEVYHTSTLRNRFPTMLNINIVIYYCVKLEKSDG